MHALISTLPKPYEDQVLRMWDALEERFGSKYVRTATVPHFTWQLGDSYALESVIPLLEQLAAEVDSFDIVVQGVEHFVSQAPIVFWRLLRTPALSKRIWISGSTWKHTPLTLTCCTALRSGIRISH